MNEAIITSFYTSVPTNGVININIITNYDFSISGRCLQCLQLYSVHICIHIYCVMWVRPGHRPTVQYHHGYLLVFLLF